jgi:hypothetical protein
VKKEKAKEVRKAAVKKEVKKYTAKNYAVKKETQKRGQATFFLKSCLSPFLIACPLFS